MVDAVETLTKAWMKTWFITTTFFFRSVRSRSSVNWHSFNISTAVRIDIITYSFAEKRSTSTIHLLKFCNFYQRLWHYNKLVKFYHIFEILKTFPGASFKFQTCIMLWLFTNFALMFIHQFITRYSCEMFFHTTAKLLVDSFPVLKTMSA